MVFGWKKCKREYRLKVVVVCKLNPTPPFLGLGPYVAPCLPGFEEEAMEKRNMFETMQGCPPRHPLGFCEVNDVIIRTFVAEGKFPWHLQKEPEKSFLTLKGEITVETDQENSVLKEGETLDHVRCLP